MRRELLENGRKAIAALVALVCVNVLAGIELVLTHAMGDYGEFAKLIDTLAAGFVSARWTWNRRNGKEAP